MTSTNINIQVLKKEAEVFESLAASARQKLADAEREARRAARPKEPDRIVLSTWEFTGEVPTVITFTKTFGGPKVYQYAAIRPGTSPRWTLTGVEGRSARTWDQLLNFITKDESASGIEKAFASIKVMKEREA